MPILRRHRWLYPIDWRELSAAIRFRRAGGRCERCGGGKRLRRLPPPHSTILPMRRTRVVLSTCHLDHDPQNNAPGNLAALCQRCHLLNDAPEHARRRAVTVRPVGPAETCSRGPALRS